MINTLSLLILGLMAASAMAEAQVATTSSTTASSYRGANSSTVKTADLEDSKEKVKDIDNEITDARMRADLGSKSLWSVKSTLTYNGASIKSPLDSVRPNYRSSAGGDGLTSLSGSIGVNYRATANDSITLGGSVVVSDPLHGNITENAVDSTQSGGGREIPRTEFSTPFVGWSRGYRLFNTQMSTSLNYNHATDSVTVDRYKIFGTAVFSQVLLADFGKSGWNGGTSINLSSNIYSGDIEDARLLTQMNSGDYKRSELSYGLFPFLQYSFNDRYSFRTVFGYFQFSRYIGYSDNFHEEPYQSLGLGISVTRDIYLYPNVQFTPKDIHSDRTNVAVTANINMF